MKLKHSKALALILIVFTAPSYGGWLNKLGDKLNDLGMPPDAKDFKKTVEKHCLNNDDILSCMAPTNLFSNNKSDNSSPQFSVVTVSSFSTEEEYLTAKLKYERHDIGKKSLANYELYESLKKSGGANSLYEQIAWDVDIKDWEKDTFDKNQQRGYNVTRRITDLSTSGYKKIYPFVLSRWLAFNGNTRYFDPKKASNYQRNIYERIAEATFNKEDTDKGLIISSSIYSEKFNGIEARRDLSEKSSWKDTGYIDVYEMILANEHYNQEKESEISTDAREMLNTIIQRLPKERIFEPWVAESNPKCQSCPRTWRLPDVFVYLESTTRRFNKHGPIDPNRYKDPGNTTRVYTANNRKKGGRKGGSICDAYRDHGSRNCIWSEKQKNEIANLRARLPTERQRYLEKKTKNQVIATAKKNTQKKHDRKLTTLLPTGNSGKFVWNAESGNITMDINNKFDLVNYFMLGFSEWFERQTQGKQFSAPEKGEFEKTSQYEERASKLKAVHEENVRAKAEELAVSKTEKLTELINQNWGKATVHSIKYDAESELFNITVGTSTIAMYSVQVPIAIDQAKRVKKELGKSKVNVVYEVLEEKGELILDSTFFVYEDKKDSRKSSIYEAEVENEVVNISKTALLEWKSSFDAQRKARLIAETEKKGRLRKERAKTYPYYAVVKCMLNGQDFNLLACINDGGKISVNTNGQSRSYGAVDIVQMRGDVFSVDLSQTFTVQARNGSEAEHFELKVIVYDSLTQNQLYENSNAGSYARVAIRD